ncbi:hypothetical protein SLE2022_144540 [Rubroshorea leprosula]
MRGGVAEDSRLEVPVYELNQSRSPNPLLVISTESGSNFTKEATVNGLHDSRNPVGSELSELEAWLPITESRNGSVHSGVLHVLCSGIGFQALLLPVALATLGWAWGTVCLLAAYAWQLYTIWLLVHLHEPAPGTRHSRYLRLSIAAFGLKLGKLLAIFPVMYLSGGSCVMLIITGGGVLNQIIKIMSGGEAKSLTGTECFLVFTCIAMVIAQIFPNLNSLASVSLTGAISAIGYCTLIWVLSLSKGRPEGISHDTSSVEKSGMRGFGNIMNAIGIIVLVFRGHNLVLEIEGTLPSTPRQPAFELMWRGVTISYIIIAMCLFPLAIAGFWAYGNGVPTTLGTLNAFLQRHEEDTSKYVIGLICLLLVISCLCSYQIYAMPVFDNLELIYISKKNKPCSRLIRAGLHLFFGGLTFFIAVTFPFLGSLAVLIGGITSPLTYAYPCFMWNSIKRPQNNGAIWCVNIGLGWLGIVLSMLLVVAASWNLADKGLIANFFKP